MTKIDPDGLIQLPGSSVRFDFVATIPAHGGQQARAEVSLIIPVRNGIRQDSIRSLFVTVAETMINALKTIPDGREGITPTEE